MALLGPGMRAWSNAASAEANTSATFLITCHPSLAGRKVENPARANSCECSVAAGKKRAHHPNGLFLEVNEKAGTPQAQTVTLADTSLSSASPSPRWLPPGDDGGYAWPASCNGLPQLRGGSTVGVAWVGKGRTPAHHLGVAGKHTEAESMTSNVIEAAIGNGSFVAPVEDRRTLLLLLAAQDKGDIRENAREDAAMDAEDIMTQADEALVIG